LVDNVAQSPLVQFRARLRRPWFGFRGGAENRLRGAVQGFFGVVAIEDLNGLGKQFPGGSVAKMCDQRNSAE
jgi:hypothetical protein